MNPPAHLTTPPTESGWTSRILAQGAKSAVALRQRLDSWSNALTGLNTTRDKTAFTLPYIDQLLTPQLLEVLYHSDDISARIVSAVPDECFREPWHVVSELQDEEDPEEIHERAALIVSDMRRFGVRAKLHEAQTWGRLYGLGAVLLGVNDGRPPWEPIDWQRVRGVDYLTVLDKRDLTPWRYYADVQAPKYGDVALYQVQPVGVFLGAPYDINRPMNQIILVHEDRLLRFGGQLTSKRERSRNQSADYSVLQKCFRALQLVHNNWQSASVLLADASQGVFKIKGLIDMIAQQPDVMNSRMALVDQMRSVVRGIVLDKDGEDFTRVSTPLAGIPEILQETWSRLAMSARMPKTVLLGDSPAGIGKSEDPGMRWWYDTIAATQREDIAPNSDKIVKLFACARGDARPHGWVTKFDSLWQLTPVEKADVRLKTAQADAIYLQEGVLIPENVALNRFGGATWSDETKIDVDVYKSILRMRSKQEAEAAKTPVAEVAPAPAKKQQRADDDQPRVPAGSPDGGEFAAKGGGTSGGKATYSTVPMTPIPRAMKGGALRPAASPGAQLPPHVVARLKELGVTKIPAAHITDVKVSDKINDPAHAHDHALIKYVDDKGKTQAGYSKQHDEKSAEKKFARVLVNRPRVEAAMNELHEKAQSSPAHAAAAVIAETGLRPGSSGSVAEHGHYGATTMEARHVTIVQHPDGPKAHIEYVGKEGVTNRAVVEHPATVAAIQRNLEGKGPRDRLFSGATREEIAAAAPKGVKLKDLRTTLATNIAEHELSKISPVKTGNVKVDARHIVGILKTVSTTVSGKLNNTPAMARKSYIAPQVIQAWGAKHGVDPSWLK